MILRKIQFLDLGFDIHLTFGLWHLNLKSNIPHLQLFIGGK